MSESCSEGSDSEVSPCSSKYNPRKALYSKKTPIPDVSAPIYDNLDQFMSAQQRKDIIPVGRHDLIAKREQEKQQRLKDEQEQLSKIQSQRFKDIQVFTTVPRKAWKTNKNLFSKMSNITGPLSVLMECVTKRFRVKVVTRNERGVRGHLIGSIEAFDKQWNLAMSDVLEVWKRKIKTKRKIPACMGEPCPPGTAASLVKLPSVSETKVKKGIVECSRYMPQVMIRGEHVVIVSVLEGL